MKYIDVSAHQGVIDWEKVKGNVDGVIIRAGYGKNNIDKQFKRNASECNRLGIPCGAYWFSYAYTADMAKAEADYLISAVKPYEMSLPLAFDWEYDSRSYAVKQGVTPTAALVKDMTNAFCQRIEKEKFYCMIYTNVDYINQYFGNLAGGRYDLWLAVWPSTVDVSKPPRKCGIWQWGGSSVPGIGGNVDTNEAYHDYAVIIAQNGLNGMKAPPVEKEPEPVAETPPAAPRPWYADVAEWVQSNGIADGTRPTEAATRAEVWTMLKRFAELQGKDYGR